MAEPASSTLIADIAMLIRAVGSLLWPVVAGYVVIRHEKQLRSLVDRLRRGKFLGQEIELEGSLKELKRQVSAVENETTSGQVPVGSEPSSLASAPAGSEDRQADSRAPHSEIKPSNQKQADDPFLREILDTAAKSPTVALMQLASGIEKLANVIWSDLDDGSKPARPSVRVLINGLSHVLPQSVPSALRTFWEVRNRIVHGRDADEHETLSALDSGISLYRSLDSFSRSYAVVTRAAIPIYTDETGQAVNTRVTGVEIEFRRNGICAIFPTTETHYAPQMVVKSQFDLDNPVHGIWIKDPVTGEVSQLYKSAALFIGEPISVKLRS